MIRIAQKTPRRTESKIGRSRLVKTTFLPLTGKRYVGKKKKKMKTTGLLFIMIAAIEPLIGSSKSAYQVFNYTWQVINETGDVVNTTSQVSYQIPWPTLEVDLCTLALSANEAWGTPTHYMPQPKPLNVGPLHSQPGCDNFLARSFLSLEPIYVCPGPTHRSRSLSSCGLNLDYFCASWAVKPREIPIGNLPPLGIILL